MVESSPNNEDLVLSGGLTAHFWAKKKKKKNFCVVIFSRDNSLTAIMRTDILLPEFTELAAFLWCLLSVPRGPFIPFSLFHLLALCLTLCESIGSTEASASWGKAALTISIPIHSCLNNGKVQPMSLGVRVTIIVKTLFVICVVIFLLMVWGGGRFVED